MNNFLSETADEKLPNSLEEGERFGLCQSFFMVPFLHKHPEKRSGIKKNQEDEVFKYPPNEKDLSPSLDYLDDLLENNVQGFLVLKDKGFKGSEAQNIILVMSEGVSITSDMRCNMLRCISNLSIILGIQENESLKFDKSQFDDNTLRSMSIASASPKMVTKLGNTSPLLSGHSNIPMITTNPPRKDYPQSRLSPVSPARSLRKYSQGSRFSRQQSQPSPKDNRYHCRGIRRSISNKITAEEEAMLRHVCSFSAIDNQGKSNYCHHMHQCCSLHNCGNSADPLHGKESHGEPGVFSCNYLHVQNDPNAACHYGQNASRICRNMGCREASTHVIGSGMCLGLDPDSIANIAFDSMKFKGATKKFNQVCLDSF